MRARETSTTTFRGMPPTISSHQQQFEIFPPARPSQHSASLNASPVTCSVLLKYAVKGAQMDEPGKELDLVVPGRLTRLAQLGHAAPVDAPYPVRRYPKHPVALGFESGLTPLGPTDESRVRRLLRTEIDEPRSRYMRPWWIESEEAAPGLVISLQYTPRRARDRPEDSRPGHGVPPRCGDA